MQAALRMHLSYAAGAEMMAGILDRFKNVIGFTTGHIHYFPIGDRLVVAMAARCPKHK
jgi:hypothetical protein